MRAEVERTKVRSGWPHRKTLLALGISPTSYYRWQRASLEEKRPTPVTLVQAYEALEEEQEAVRQYALDHTELRHRELAWRMIDEGVVCLSPSTVYRILREAKLVCPWSRRKKRVRADAERAQHADARWGTDIMHLRIGSGQYYFVGFLDEYSRYLVHWELLTSMDGASVSLAAEAALETLPRLPNGKLICEPEIRSDNGSCFISREFREVLDRNGLLHQRIKPHCPEENGLVERGNRTWREAFEELAPQNREEAEQALRKIAAWYNHRRLHRSLGYLRPVDYYRGDPERLHAERRTKLAAARHHRRQHNLQLRQPTLALGALTTT